MMKVYHMHCRWILIFVILISSHFNGFSQNNPYGEVSIASPTAASLGKYADIPVNAHTGIPQISIPIYTVKEGPLSLPISLSYHAGGVKVLETAGWVGLGWSLNAGGVITRTVQGAPDERQTSSVYNQTHGYLSDSGYSKYMYVPTNPEPTSTPPRNPWPWLNDWKTFAEGRKDGEPDMFFFNVGSVSGKFFIRDDGKPILMPDQDVRIEYDYTPGSSKSISSFTLTTPDGVKYYFGRTVDPNDVDPVEISNPFTTDGGLGQGQVISSWYLNRIASADNIFSIYLKYQAESYGFYTISMFPIKYSETSKVEYSLIKNIINGVRLNQIKTSFAKVDFVANTVRQDLNGTTQSYIDDINLQSKALDQINISDSLNQYCKRFNFAYDYFVDNSSLLPGNFSTYGFTVDKKRLKLLNVQEQSCDGAIVIPPHQFDYFTEMVPRRLSFGMDHWGFYNGAATNNTLIPTYTINDTMDVTGANRDANWPAMRGGALKRITYPTKGYSEFEYENNTTWVSYVKRGWSYLYSISAGYDGSTNWNTMTQTFSGNLIKANFSNSFSVGSQAFLEIYQLPSNTQMGAWVLEPQQTLSVALNYPAGNYSIRIRKLTQGYTGYGTTATFNELTNLPPIQKNEIVGGLRIKSIRHNDNLSSANDMVTNFSYDVNGQSSGVLYSRPAYVFKLRNDIVKEIGLITGVPCPMTGEQAGCVVCGGGWYLKSGAGIRPMGTSQGNHIGYSEVKISQSGNGYSIKRFYGSDRWDTDKSDVALRRINTAELCNLNITNYPFIPVPFEYQRGEPKYEAQYTETGTLLKESWWTLQFQDDPIKTPCFIASYRPDWEQDYSGYGAGGPNTLGSYYNIITKKKKQTDAVETVYANGNSVQTTSSVFYESNFHTQPTRKVTVNSKGETLETRYKYVFDYRISSCDNISNADAVYAADTVLAASNRLLSIGDGAYPKPYWAWQYYMYDLGQARNKYVNARRVNYTSLNNACLSCIIFAKSNADNWFKPILEMQQQNINALIETSSWNAGKLLSSSYIKYDYAVLPSTAVYPSKTYGINLAAPSTSFTSSDVSGSTISRDSRYEEESSAIFENGNLVEITPRSGVKTAYLWGYNNTLPIAKATGIDYATLKAAYPGANNVSNLRNQPTLSAALVNAYEYHPFLGITKEYDPNGKILSYEYDKAQRMIMVRDQYSNILKRICYGYSGQPADCNVYYSNAKQGSFTRNNCSSGYAGSQVTYSVVQGTYTSTISQADADAQAQNDVNNNGQNYANTNGTCTSAGINVQGYNTKNIQYNVKFTNNATGTFYIFSLLPNTYSFSVLGQIPAGTYAVQFYKMGVPTTATFVVNGYTQSGSVANFYNISISSTTSVYMY